MRLGERVLLLGPTYGFGVAAVFQPAVRIGDHLTMKSFDNLMGGGVRIGGHIKSVNSER